jgi:hypothetical protein
LDALWRCRAKWNPVGGTKASKQKPIAFTVSSGEGYRRSQSAGYGYRLNQAMQLWNPSAIFSSGRLRPMKTMRLSRFSSSFQGR